MRRSEAIEFALKSIEIARPHMFHEEFVVSSQVDTIIREMLTESRNEEDNTSDCQVCLHYSKTEFVDLVFGSRISKMNLETFLNTAINHYLEKHLRGDMAEQPEDAE